MRELTMATMILMVAPASQTSDVPYINLGQGILMLDAPSLEHELTMVVIPVDGSQPDLDCTQVELLSQVDNPQEESDPHNNNRCQSASNTVEEQHLQLPRMSSRLANQNLHAARMDTRGSSLLDVRDTTGTNLTTRNSFALLDVDDINARDLDMGASSASFFLEKINYLKDLEVARHAIRDVQKKSYDR
jgi:hypothetical protein